MMKHHFLETIAFCVVFFASFVVCAEHQGTASLESKIFDAVERNSACVRLKRRIEGLEVENYEAKLRLYEMERELQLNKERLALSENLLKNAESMHEGFLKLAKYVETHEMYQLFRKDRFHEFVVHPMPEGLVSPNSEVSVKKPAGMSTDWLLLVDGKSSGVKMEHLWGASGLCHGMTLFYRGLLSKKTTVYLLLLECGKENLDYYIVHSAMELDIVPHVTGLCEVLFDSALIYSPEYTVALLLPPKMNDMNYVESVKTTGGTDVSAADVEDETKSGDLLMSLNVKKAEAIVGKAREKSQETVVIASADFRVVDRHKTFGFSVFGDVVREAE